MRGWKHALAAAMPLAVLVVGCGQGGEEDAEHGTPPAAEAPEYASPGEFGRMADDQAIGTGETGYRTREEVLDETGATPGPQWEDGRLVEQGQQQGVGNQAPEEGAQQQAAVTGPPTETQWVGQREEGTVRGKVTTVNYTQGVVSLFDEGTTYLLRGTPEQVAGLEVGDTVSLPFVSYEQIAWIDRNGISADEAYTGRGQASGQVEEVDLAAGHVVVEGNVYRGHPELLEPLQPGQSVRVSYGQLANSQWVQDVQPTGQQQPGAQQPGAQQPGAQQPDTMEGRPSGMRSPAEQEQDGLAPRHQQTQPAPGAQQPAPGGRDQVAE